MATPPRRSGRQPLTTPVYLFPTYQRRQSATSDMSSSITTPSNAPTLSRSSCDSNHGGSVRRIDLQDSNAARNFPRTSSMHVPSASVGFRQGTVRVISTPRRESCRKVVRREETPESEVGDGPEDEEPDPPCIPNHNSARASISSATTLAGSIFSELYDGGSEDEGNGYDEVKNSNNDNSYETVQDVIRQADFQRRQPAGHKLLRALYNRLAKDRPFDERLYSNLTITAKVAIVADYQLDINSIVIKNLVKMVNKANERTWELERHLREKNLKHGAQDDITSMLHLREILEESWLDDEGGQEEIGEPDAMEGASARDDEMQD